MEDLIDNKQKFKKNTIKKNNKEPIQSKHMEVKKINFMCALINLVTTENVLHPQLKSEIGNLNCKSFLNSFLACLK